MTSLRIIGTSCLALTLSAALAAQDAGDAKAEKPTPKAPSAKLESIGPIGFAPNNVLLVSDPKAATIYSFDIADVKGKGFGVKDKVEKIDQKIAAMLGTEARRIRIVDVATNPKTQQVFVALSRGRGADASPVLLAIGAGGKIQEVSLKGRAFSKAKLENVPALRPADAAGRGGRGRGRRRGRGNQRLESITDIAWVEGQVVVAGISNEEFASKLRVLEYPFKKADSGTSVEIYHGAHGAFETRSPVRTFIPYKLDDRMHIIAAYTCTPLVIFPMGALEPGKKVRGKTIAELGNRNRPLDMIVYKVKGRDYLLLANSSRGVMKVPTEGMKDQKSISERVGGGGTAGQPYETIEELKGVMQLDKLDDKHAVVLLRSASGEMTLQVIPLP